MKIIHIVESFATGIFDFLVDITNNMPDCEFIIIHGLRVETPANFSDYFPKGTLFFAWNNAVREISIRNDLLALKELLWVLRNIDNINIIHLHSSKAGFIGRIASRMLGFHNQVIYTPHGVSFLRKDISRIKYYLFIYFERLADVLAGRVEACSASEAEAFNRVGIKAGFVNNAVSCDASPTKINHSSRITIVTLGRISFQKNPELFDEVAKYFEADSMLSFLWVGDGELRYKLTSNNISTTGWVSKKSAIEYLQNADIYLSTSLWEGLPISVLQAMCLSKPLVLMDCTGNKDLIFNNGFLCQSIEEVIEAINCLKLDASKRIELGLNSKILAEQSFSIRQMISEYFCIYNEVKMKS